ncbi:hypothetical protein [Methylobacterium brachythecii]|uniref:Uncharacterized protein n=1 Tax=Methylobacterium brachythecii TaxID=1176177 RepID=A0A7W6AJ82_9HYPH|nr:hypothetical protein [Methylobacterium brachythecii]MBB3903476.1 hypothetical protein [Methylobacterium brachythecii]GLS44171.1 hypothetical protein GCM10007884_21580 [Methylobacterium brachythecii]
MHSNDKGVYSGAFVLAALCLVMLLWLFNQNELTRQPHLVSVSSTSFLEKKDTGEQIMYPFLHAQVIAPARADVADLVKYAQNIFAARLRSDAEVQAKQMIWITFTFAESPQQVSGEKKTYREIYVREGTSWHRLSRGSDTLM